MWFAYIFYLSVGCLFTLLMVSFEVQKWVILMNSYWSILSITACADKQFGVIPMKPLPNLWPQESHSHSFLQVSCSLSSFIEFYHPFELIFVWSGRWKSSFILLLLTIQLSEHGLLKALFFPPWISLEAFLKIICS